jgi:hypothetical protein
MESVKEVFAVLGAIVGVLTGLVTLYAKYLDLRKNAAREEAEAAVPSSPERVIELEERDLTPAVARRAPEPAAMAYAVASTAVEERPVAPRWAPRPDAATVAQARQMVKAPAIALMAAGVLSLLSNLCVSGYGFVDQFVTPLNADTKARREAVVAGRSDLRFASPAKAGKSPGDISEDASAVMAIIMLLGFSVASVGATWAGYSMLNLRSYWLSVAGSIAVMPGACMCCMAGFPIGIWSLMVLLRPEVSASFR